MSLRVNQHKDATHLHIRGEEDDACLSVRVIEYAGKLMVRADLNASISSGFDLDPESALQLSEALKRHAMNVLQEVEA